jgi:hypothetical protein
MADGAAQRMVGRPKPRRSRQEPGGIASAAFSCSKPAARAEGRPAQAYEKWPDPKLLPDGLLPVAPFDHAFSPDRIAPWVRDISERMPCPPDLVGAAAMVALGVVIGRKIAVRPQRKDAPEEDAPSEAIRAAIEERAAIRAGCVPAIYPQWARLNHQEPALHSAR